MKKPKLRFASALLVALLLSAAVLFHVSTAQHATPSVNGSIGLTEYGTAQNQQANGGTTWYVTWDETNLYVGTSGANTTEGAVLYIDADRPLPAGTGTNADGNTTGQSYDATNFSSLPFRADFVAYYKDGYREYRTADGAGGWSAPTAGFGAYASNGATVRELAIPWSAVTGAGRPDSFNFFAYVTSAGGFVYGEVPPENPDGFIGTSAAATRFYYVASTADGASTKPFANNFAASRTFVVNSTADTGDAVPGDNLCDAGGAVCTLRAAIQEANAVASLDVINFQIPAVPDPNCDDISGVCTVSPASALPALGDPVVIDGYTQTGATANTLATGDNAALKVELNGTSAGAGAEGLTINGGTTTVRGLVINRFGGRGIEMNNADFNVVTGCFIGTDPGGTVDQGNGQDGVFIQGLVGGSDSNRVGGTSPAERNLISGNNGNGIGGAGGGANTIQGNYVGTDRNGTADLGNSDNGVVLAGAGSTLGGTTAAARNVVSGNDGVSGVSVSGGGHVIQGNYVGTDATGALDLGNSGDGISFNVTNGATVGGAASGAGNVVSGNGDDGVSIGNSSNVNVRGNLVGTNAAGTAGIGNAGHGVHVFAGTAESNAVGGAGAGEANTIAFNGGDGVFMADTNTTRNPVLSNSIHANGGLGIDLNPNGVTANDPLDPDTGPNRLQNYPVLTVVSTSGGATTVNGTLNSTPNSTFRVEFFSNTSCDASGFGEGQTFLGAKTVTTDASGNAVFASDPLAAVPASRVVTSTATVTNDPADATNVNNTSEFSQCAQELLSSTTYVVNTTADTNDLTTDDGLCLDATGFCSLRAAIQQANANPSADTINFAIPLVTPGCIVSGVCTISPASALPAVSQPATINGYTQPGSSPNTLATGDNAVINIQLDGSGAGAGADGLRFTAGSSAVRGLAIYSFAGDGVELSGAGSNTVAGNFIGHTSQGNVAGFGNGGNGVHVNGAGSNTVGGSTPAERNLIAASMGDGVNVTGVAATGNTVAGNYIGTDRSGTADFGNDGNGVFIAAPSNAVGGSTATPGTGFGNVISGNTLAGVRITTNGNNNSVAGNLIGLQAGGTAALRNDLEGVFITNTASSNTVGGASSSLRNVISGHTALTTSDGVEINGAGTAGNTVAGNYIGTNAAGTAAIPNTDGVKVAAGAQSNTVGGSTATPGAAPGNVISGNNSDGVELTGTNTSSNTVAGNLIGLQAGGTAALANSVAGVNLTGSSSSNTVGGAASNLRNVVSGGGDGVLISGSNGNTVAGNYIGTDITGALDRGNTTDGVEITGISQSNTIGGLTSTPGTAPGNVIAGNNSDGVEITGASSTLNTISGNLIGLAAGGTALLRNDSNGVLISNADSNTVGGTTATARNVITGGTASTSDGVDIQSNADGTVVAGNYIGTDINGAGVNGGGSDFGSGGDGVRIAGNADNNTVGGAAATPGAAPGNVISGNNSDGVEITGTGPTGNAVQGNLIGTQANGTTAYANGANGVLISATASTPSNTVGGSTATPGTGLGNVISGNTTNGVQVSTNADSCLIRGNLIGLAAGGTSALGNGANGVHFTGAQNGTVGGATGDLRNVISANGSNGVLVNEGQTGSLDNNTVAGNYIGTDVTGAVDLGNTGDGVHIDGADGSTVGGAAAATGAAPGNVISGNGGDGVELTDTGGDTHTNTVAGNFIGTQANGTGALANTGDGVGVRAGVETTTVGGTAATARNVISANGSDGVELASGGHTVQGNYIGTQSDGATALGNTAHGVHVSAANTTVNTVGGTTAGTGNTIAFNGGDGVYIPTGLATVRRNSIHSNTGLGIDLGSDGVTPNDAGDGDTGANNLQNFPVITTAVQGSTVVTGTLNSTPSTTFTIEFFSSPAADPTGNGEGRTFLDSTTVTTDATGNAAFTYTVATTVAAGQYVSATATDPAGLTSEFSNARNVIIATLARLVEFAAVEQDGVVRLDWKTGYEVDNLGFNLYRETNGRRALLNPTLIAGSALVAGPGVALTAGNSYAWADAGGGPGAAYWLEELDLAGRSKTYGPFHPSRGANVAAGSAPRGARSPLISQLSDEAPANDAQRQVSPSDAGRAKQLTRASVAGASEAAREKQRWLASQASLKISVRAGGWYRVTRDELVAAGLNPAADPARLQLYAGGVEVPMAVDMATWLLPEGGVEFYGEGLDVPSTDTRVYWLVEGATRGLRTGARRASSSAPKGPGPVAAEAVTVVPVGPPSLPYFKYTAERRERTVYFSSLLNGEAENFFGRVVNTASAAQTLAARNVYPLDAQTATLGVSVQGVSLGRHHVTVVFNGVTLGALDFAGQAKRTAVFPVDSHLLRDGDNQVQLVSGAPGDVSLTDYLRLNYLHSMRADDDRLRFSAPAGVVSVGGFTTPDVRVFDVTDPAAPEELPTTGAVTPDPRGGWGVKVGVAGAGSRELLALTGARVSRPASVAANTPSRWSVDAGQRADMVVVTHGEFAGQVAPLVAARAAEGLEVRVVNVEDVFDEFSFGAHTPQAVRDFLAHTRASWEKPPAYVLLVGDGSYDPRGHLGRGRFDLVPSKLVDAGAMETASDDWFADFDDDGVADLAVGRLPVRTQAEAAVVVGKIVSRAGEEFEPSALLVADRDGADGYSFETATDGLQSLLPGGVEVSRVNRRGQDAATVRSQIVAGVNAGPLLVNWMGHGSIDVWTGEGLLRGADAPALTNGSRLPLFVMMTCLNGYYEGTGLDSLAESMLKAEGGGAYAVWASTGMTEPFAQAAANRELYRIIFSEGEVRLGDAVRRAKYATGDRDVRRTWVFFGDPSSRLR